MADTSRMKPEFAVHLDGNKLQGEARAAVIGIRVFQTRFGASSFEMVVADPDLKWQTKPTFTDCKEVKIELGVPGKLKKVFDGEVTAWRTELERSGPTVLVVRGMDRSHRLMRAHKTRTYQNASPLDCAQQIAGRYGLTAKTSGGALPPVKSFRFQANQTDFEFLRGMADLEGYMFWIDGSDLHFERPQLSSVHDCEFSFGEDLKTFLPSANFRRPAASVEVSAWDVAGKAEICGKAKKGQELWSVPGKKPGVDLAKFSSTKSQLSLVESQVGTQDHADTVARAALTRRAMEFLTAEVEVQGHPAVKPGAVVNIKKVGEYSGPYLVTEANHFYDAAGYQCIFYVARDKWGDSSAPAQQQHSRAQPAAKASAAKPPRQVGPRDFLLQIIDDGTGQPIAQLDVEVTLPSGQKRLIQSDREGFVEVREAGKGSNDVACALEGAVLDRTLAFVGTGARSGAGQGNAPPDLPSLPGPLVVARVQEHKVKAGDTLASLASNIGLDWRELARFNWGVSDPQEINDADIVYLPRPWSASGLASGTPHQVRVRRIAGRLPDLKLLYQIDPHAPDAKSDVMILEAEDGSWRHEIPVQSLAEVEPHWVELVFPKPPAGVRFNLIQDPRDGSPPLYVARGASYADFE